MAKPINKEHKIKRRLVYLVNWMNSNIDMRNKVNRDNSKELLFGWIANQSHVVNITNHKHNSLVQHLDRANLRQHLRDYVNYSFDKNTNNSALGGKDD